MVLPLKLVDNPTDNGDADHAGSNDWDDLVKSIQTIIAPAQITSDQNNYSPAGADKCTAMELDADSSFRSIGGLANTYAGRYLTLLNKSANTILLSDELTTLGQSSTAGNRFALGGYDYPIFGKHAVKLFYSSGLSRWIVLGQNPIIPSFNFGYYHRSERTAGDEILALTAASGGTAATIAGDTKHPAIIRFTSGTSTTGSGSIFSTSNTFGALLLGNSSYFRYDAVVNIDTLSDGTNTYKLRVGFIDTNNAESTDGVFFRYTHSVNSGKWELVARSNGTETVTNATNTAVAAATWYRLTIIVNPAGNVAEFFQDGVSLGTVTTNIPTGAGRQTGYGIMFLKSAGTADINFLQSDAIQLVEYFNTSR